MADPRPVSARDRGNLEFAQAAEAAEARGDFDAALALWRRAGSFVNVGYAYDTGLGRPVDKAKAMAWYRRGYRRGCAPCANNIAILYREQGRPELADRWFRREAALTPGAGYIEIAKALLDQGGAEARDRARLALVDAIESHDVPENGYPHLNATQYAEAKALLAALPAPARSRDSAR